jgi:hypothetical protein
MRRMADEVHPAPAMPDPVRARIRRRQAGTLVAAASVVGALVAVTVVGVGTLRTPAPAPSPPAPAAPTFATLGVGWTELPGPPEANGGMAYLWAGDRLLAFGGVASGSDQPSAEAYALGPAGDSWSHLPVAPLSGSNAAAYWTGREAIFFGVGADRWSGEAFDPVTSTWRVMADPPIARRDAAMTVWTGSELIVWGGGSRTGPPDLTGAAYDPTTDAWRRIADGLIGLNQGDTVWTGHQMVVVGSWLGPGNNSSTKTAVGAEYDPATDTWLPMPPTSLSPQATSTVWVDHSLLAWDYIPQAQVGDVPVRSGDITWGDARPMPLDFSECYPGSAVVAGEASEEVFAWFCGQAAVWDPTRATWQPVDGGPLDVMVESGGREIHRYRFAEMTSMRDAVVMAVEGITVEKGGAPCYGCEGAPHALWVYRPPSNARTATEVAPITFEPAPDWNTITTSTDPAEVEPYEAPMSWASNEPFSEQDLAGHTNGEWLADPIEPFHSLQQLSPAGVFVAATLYGRTDRPDSLSLPLRLSDGRFELHWEGGPFTGVSRYFFAGTVGGRVLEVRVYLGTRQPTGSLLETAQSELDRMRLPPAP